MRNPWIARDTFERVVTLLEAQIEKAEAQHSAECARTERLTTELLALKRQGFNPDPLIRQRDEEPDLPALVMEAIVGRAGTTGSTLGTQLMAEAQRRLREGQDAEVVASAIWTGDGDE